MPAAIAGLQNYGATPPSSNTPTGSRTLGKNEFLKLLTTQLANQDPLSPTDNQAFIAQLAQFASVEQAEAANSRLDSLLLAQAASNQTSVANLVGKDIIYKTDSIVMKPEQPAFIQGNLSSDAKQVNAIIKDGNGKVVRTLTLHDVKAGQVNLTWDGRDDNGAPLSGGTYKVTLTAADIHGQSLTIESRGQARATGVTFEAGYPELILNGVRVKMSDIVQINEATTAAPGATS